jgi:hypothetical protein
MAKFHVVVFKPGRVGNQICIIHLFSRGTDFGKLSSRGKFFPFRPKSVVKRIFLDKQYEIDLKMFLLKSHEGLGSEGLAFVAFLFGRH